MRKIYQTQVLPSLLWVSCNILIGIVKKRSTIHKGLAASNEALIYKENKHASHYRLKREHKWVVKNRK